MCVCFPQSKRVSSSVLTVGKQRRGLMSGVNGEKKEQGKGQIAEAAQEVREEMGVRL